MATDLSALSLSAIVEHMQADLALVSKRLLQPGPLSPGVRALAVQQIRHLRARLNSLHAVFYRADADVKVLDDDLAAPMSIALFHPTKLPMISTAAQGEPAMHATNPLELPDFIIEHKPPEPIFHKSLSWQMARGRRLAWLDWLRAVLRWPMAPWRCMSALLDRVAQLETVMTGHLTTLSRLQSALDHDALTGAHSRLYFMAALRQEIARFARENRSPGGAKGFVVGLLDLDQFKSLNDQYGHATGDEVLIQVVAHAHRVLRRDLDVFARYGGDEFVFLLPQTSIQNAYVLADKLRAGLAALQGVEPRAAISVSIGLAACPVHGQDAESLLQAADRAMYRAKSDRNAVCIAEAP